MKLPSLTPYLAIFALTACSDNASENSASWPTRPITISCFAAAGGGTDLISRLVAKEMESELGVKINVVNRTGGRGAAAINHVANSKRNGYDWGGFSESVLPGSVLGITETTAKDWTFFMVAGAPGVISVPENSPFKSLDDLIAKAKSEPKSIKVGAGLVGGLWHTKLLALQKAADVTFTYIPYQGSQPSQLAALSGEIDIVLTSLSEQADLIKGKKLRPLAMIEKNAATLNGHGEIPSAATTYPAINTVPVSQFLGFALPSDTPPEILKTITSAFGKLMKNPAVAEYAASRNLSLIGHSGEEAATHAAAAESAWTWLLHELGVSVKSPESLGIPKP